nr:hypothetical protein [Desulfuromusa kysingii]
MCASAEGIGVGVAGGKGALTIFEGEFAPTPAARVDRGIDFNIALGVQRQGISAAPSDIIIDEDIAVAAGVCTVNTFNGDVGATKIGRKLRAGNVAIADGNGIIVGINQPFAGFSVLSCCCDHQIMLYSHLCRAGFDKAAVAAVGGRGIEGAGDDGFAVHHVAHQVDGTVFAGGQGLRLADAAVVDDTAGQLTGGFGSKVNHPAIGFDGSALFNVGIKQSLFDFYLNRATEVEGDFMSGTEKDVAMWGFDAALIDDARCDQGDGAAVGGVEVALINDGIGAGACKSKIAGHEIVIAYIQC